MSDGSLVARDSFLPGMALPDDVQARLEVHEREAGNLSGERLFATRPDAYKAAVRLLARGHSLREVAAIVDISVPSVLAIRRREGLSVLTASNKADLSATLADVARLGAEQARDRLAAGEKIALDKLMLASAIATDKAMLLAGEATQRIEHVVRDEGDDWEDELARARAAGKVIDVEDMGIEVPPAEVKGAIPFGPAAPDPMPGETGPAASEGEPDTIPTDITSAGIASQVVGIVLSPASDTQPDTTTTPSGTMSGTVDGQASGDAGRGAGGRDGWGEGVAVNWGGET